MVLEGEFADIRHCELLPEGLGHAREPKSVEQVECSLRSNRPSGYLIDSITTQTLTVGVYRETDDEPGFSNYQSKVDGGDQRPSDDVSEELMVELMKENSRGRLTRHEYKAFDKDGERTVEVSNPMSFAKGLASFKNLPADEEFTVRFRAGSDRKAVVDAGSARNGRDVDTYGGDLEDGTSVGAFGDEGGAGAEVRLCPMSSSSKDDMCSTFGYQWASGSISGAVTRRGAGVGDAAVNLEAITNNHSPDDNTKTSRSSGDKGQLWLRRCPGRRILGAHPRHRHQQGGQCQSRDLPRRGDG